MDRTRALLLAALAGALTVFGFAPFGLALLPLASFAMLVWLWQRASTPRAAAATGFAFGVGLFGCGASWVYIALETFGGMPAWIGVIATAAFVAYLALWPALAGALAVRFAPRGTLARAMLAAALWTAGEWLRGYVFTGFPWLALGYAELPGSALAGFAPIGGVFVVSLACAITAACIAHACDALASARRRELGICAGVALALFASGALLRTVEWTTPAGAPVAVSLVQGDVPQERKFAADFRAQTFALYIDLVEASHGRLVVLPESAFPIFADEVPPSVLQRLARSAVARDGAVLLGLFTEEQPLPGTDEPRYYNTVVALTNGPVQLYRKNHLVPFGETIPAKPLVGWFIRNVLAIPLADQTSGGADQPVLEIAGQHVAMNICYEDAFGSELINGARHAGLLVNVTNDAWYGHSIAAWQHNQIAAMRALELGRPMLRATNTGVTSAIAHDGSMIAALPWFTRGTLEVTIAGRGGATPYLRVGDALALALMVVIALGAWWAGRR